MTEFEKELLTKLGAAILRALDPARDADMYRDLRGQMSLLSKVVCDGSKEKGTNDMRTRPMGWFGDSAQPAHGADYPRADAVER